MKLCILPILCLSIISCKDSHTEQASRAQLSPSEKTSTPAAEGIYPQGDKFPFMGYSGIPARDALHGFNVAGPSYGNQEAQKKELAEAEAAGLSYPYHIGIKMNFHAKPPNKPRPFNAEEIRREVANQVKAVCNNPSICWWYITPEEIRPWRKKEMEYLKIVSETIRETDPHSRPIWMYEPNHRTAKALQETGKYQDIIGKGFYCNLAGFKNSRVWIKWSMQQQTQAIAALEKIDGRKRIPLVLPELCGDPKDPAEDHLIPKWTRHDVYLGLMCGGKGVAIWSLFPRKEVSRTWQIWYDSYGRLARELTGSPNLGAVFLHGKPSQRFPIKILSGPKEISMLKGAKNDLESQTTTEDEKRAGTIKLPALTVAEYEYEGSTYIFICNSSSNQTIKYQSAPYPQNAQVWDPCNQKQYHHAKNLLYGWLPPLGVRCYRISHAHDSE